MHARGLTPSPLALSAAFALNAALVAYLGHQRLPAIWLCAAGVALFVWGWTRQLKRLIMVAVNAIVLSLPTAYYFGGGGEGASSDIALPSLNPDLRGSPREGVTIVADNVFPGVILVPEPKEHTTLVRPPDILHRDLSAASREPIGIPFAGTYWIYKRPDRRLPKTAVTIRGDPDDKTFRSTDSRDMVMEAHQNLGTFIYAGCCRAIELAIRNRDRYPGSVAVELMLINSQLAGQPAFVLTPQPVKSTPRWSQGTRPALLETLVFELPRNPAIQRFDEFAVRYILNGVRSDRSPGIAIERFVLIPR